MSKELFSQIIGPLNKGVNQQANSFILPGFAKTLENGNCDLVEGLKKRLGSVPVKRVDNLAQNAGGQSLTNPIKWDEAWVYVYNRSTDERFVLFVVDDSSVVQPTGNPANNSYTISSISSTTDLFVGAGVTGTGIPSGSKIVDIGTNKITIDKKATASGTGVTLTVESSKTFVTGVSNIEPISGILPSVVPIEQGFQNVTTTNLAYLKGSGRARDRFRATSFQDYVFITNIQKDTAFDSSETLTRYNISAISNAYQPTKAQVWVKLVDYDTLYSIDIELDDGSKLSGHYMTPSLTDDDGNSNIVSSAQIATRLVDYSDTVIGKTTNGNSTISNVYSSLIKRVHGGETISGTGIPSNTYVGTVGTDSFTLVNASGVAVNATATSGTVTPTADTTIDLSTVKNLSSLTGVVVGATVTGTGIAANTWITAVSGNTITLSQKATATGTTVSLTIQGTSLTLAHGLNDLDTGNKLTFEVKDSQILIGLDGSNAANRYFKSFVASDARGNALMSGFSNRVTSITELPSTSWEGYTIIVAPDGAADKSSYYLKFNAENTTTNGDYARGSWEEVGGWGTKGHIDDNTMPHAFIYYRNDDGVVKFTFQPFSGTTYTDGGFSHDIPGWTKRLSGDNDEVKQPSFITKKISDLVFFKNRLGFISGENIILSEAGAYFNFWRQSALQVIDNDPIDLTAVSNDVAVLNYALQQQDELVLFSNENQFRLYSGDNVTFSPETASVGRISSISMESQVKPQQVGPQVIFPVKEGDYTGLHTFITTDRTVGINLGQTAVITETVPKYIPKNIDSLAVSRTDQYLVALSKDDPNALYIYQFFWEAAGGSLTNRQNAWSKWTFPNKSIYWCDFVEGTLFKLVKYVENSVTRYYLEAINASRPPQESSDLFLLDRQFSDSVETDVGLPTFAYNNLTNITTVTLPTGMYTVNPSQFVVIKQDKTDVNEAEKRWIVADSIAAGVNSFTLSSLGNFTGCSYVFGEKFSFKFEPPQLMPYSKTATDNTFIGNRTGRLQLRYLDVYYNDARYFTVDVTPTYRTKQTYEFDRRWPLNANITIGQKSEFEEAKFRAYVQSKNDQVTIEVVNNSIDQAKFVALEWTGLYYDVARKYG